MVSRSILITLCILLLASLSFGQGFAVSFYSVEQRLTTECDGTSPIPDGTIVFIMHDPTFNGPSDDDYQPVVGTETGNVNYNSFEVNGTSYPDTVAGPGCFIINSNTWQSVGSVPPSPFFYLIICLGDRHYYSSTFAVGAGAPAIFLGPTQVYHWFCVETPCLDNICVAPARPTNLTATTTMCDGIHLTWAHTGVNVEGFRVRRGDDLIIAELPADAREYTDSEAPNGQSTYWVRALRNCPDQTIALSTQSAPATGTRPAGPPVPNLVSASVDTCHYVVCTVSVAMVSGLNEVRLYRVVPAGDPLLVATKTNVTAGQQFPMRDLTPATGQQEYYAVSWSAACGEGTQSTHRMGEALPDPVGTVTIDTPVATCSDIQLTWSYSGDDEADLVKFWIKKNNAFIDSVDANVHTYTYTSAVPGVQAAYRIAARNGCGFSAESDPVMATRLDAPDAVTGVSTVAMCNCIEVHWTDLTGDITDYNVYRNNTQIGTVNPGTGVYEDCDATLVPGTNYTYNVAATNTCGEGDHSANVSGALANQNAGTATLALASQGPPDWDYSLTWVSGCVSRLTIRSLCDGTTASYNGTGDWQVQLYDEGDSVVFWTDSTPLDEDQGTITGFRLSNSTGCSGHGTWTAGTQEGDIEGPLPISAGRELPTEYSLAVYPNPFNPTTTLEFALPQATFLNVSVFDITGRLVSQIANGTFDAGYHMVRFEASNLPSGLYFARVQSNEFVTTKKLMLLK